MRTLAEYIVFDFCLMLNIGSCHIVMSACSTELPLVLVPLGVRRIMQALFVQDCLAPVLLILSPVWPHALQLGG